MFRKETDPSYVQHELDRCRKYNAEHREELRQSAVRARANRTQAQIREKDNSYYLRQYGITLEDYENKLKEQDFRCAICKELEKNLTRKLHVDHCHITKQVRGLLCGNCNTSLGKFKDNINLIGNAKHYLESYIVKNTYVQTVSGTKIYLDDISENVYNIKDIAHSLSQKCRFNGHTDRFLSVGQHSVLVSQMVAIKNPELALEALMHDVGEFIMPDIPRPIKQKYPEIELFEYKITQDIFQKYNLNWPLSKEICQADDRMLITEATQFFKNIPREHWGLEGVEPYAFEILPWKWEHARDMFLDRWNFLMARKAFREEGLGDDTEASSAISL